MVISYSDRRRTCDGGGLAGEGKSREVGGGGGSKVEKGWGRAHGGHRGYRDIGPPNSPPRDAQDPPPGPGSEDEGLELNAGFLGPNPIQSSLEGTVSISRLFDWLTFQTG